MLDSATLRGAVHWYTSMVGKKATLAAVKQLAWQHGATAVRTTELSQGASAERLPRYHWAYRALPLIRTASVDRARQGSLETAVVRSQMNHPGPLKRRPRALRCREDGAVGNRMVLHSAAIWSCGQQQPSHTSCHLAARCCRGPTSQRSGLRRCSRHANGPGQAALQL